MPVFKTLTMKRRKSDILWKVVMEEVFDDLLRFIFPDADQFYDMERGFEFLEKELAEMYPEPDKGSDTRFADKLVKVFHRELLFLLARVVGKCRAGLNILTGKRALYTNIMRFPSWILRMKSWRIVPIRLHK